MNEFDFLQPASFIDSGASAVEAFAREAAGSATDAREKALRLYTAVRDGIVYDPYIDFGDAEFYRATPSLSAAAPFVSARPLCSQPLRARAASPRASAMPT